VAAIVAVCPTAIEEALVPITIVAIGGQEGKVKEKGVGPIAPAVAVTMTSSPLELCGYLRHVKASPGCGVMSNPVSRSYAEISHGGSWFVKDGLVIDALPVCIDQSTCVPSLTGRPMSSTTRADRIVVQVPSLLSPERSAKRSAKISSGGLADPEEEVTMLTSTEPVTPPADAEIVVTPAGVPDKMVKVVEA
jgi:hypothetical protein